MLLLWELKYWILFIIVVLICLSFLLTDSRFSIKRKLIFCLIMCVLFVISLYIEKAPYLIIKDLFWYSLVLNISFIFHVLIMSRLFDYYRKRNEYVSFLISRTSFFLSLSNILYAVRIIRQKLSFIFFSYKHREDILGEYNFIARYVKNNNFNKNYLKYAKKILGNNKKLSFVWNFIGAFIYCMLTFISIILLHFLNVFNNYSLILLGINKPAFNLKNVVYSGSLFMFLLLLSIIIGIPRLYILWMFQLIIEIYKILNFQYIPTLHKSFKKKDLWGKIKEIKEYKISSLLCLTYEKKFWYFFKIYEKPYHKLFMFDLCKFLLNKYDDHGEFGCVWGEPGTIYENYDEYLEYPIRKVYKFHKWEDLAVGYCNVCQIYFFSPSVVEEFDEEAIYMDIFDYVWKYIKLFEITDADLAIKLLSARELSQKYTETIKKRNNYAQRVMNLNI